MSDLSPLAGMPLQELAFSPMTVATGFDAIRAIKSLKKIHGMPSSEFWKKYDAGEYGAR